MSNTVSTAPMRSGDRFFEWTVIDPDVRIQGKNRTYAAALVECSCPARVRKIIHQHHLRSGNTQSCGHVYESGEWRRGPNPDPVKQHPLYRLWREHKDEMCPEWQDPEKFYGWADENPKPGKTLTLLQVDKTRPLGPDNTRWGREQPEGFTPYVKHGYARQGDKKHPMYRLWGHIVTRTENPKNHAYKNYGARGIRMWEPWRNDPVRFIGYVERLPNYGEPGRSIDRIDVNKGYEPMNLRWATREEQAGNKQRRPMYGVEQVSGSATWRVRLKRNGEFLGRSGFATVEDAIAYRDELLADLDPKPQPLRRTVLVRAD